MNFITINSSQNVNIQFKSASLFERIIAFIIDQIIISIYIFLAIHSFDFFWYELTFINKFCNKEILLFFVFLPIIFYSFLFETFTSGYTIGKYLMRLRVIKIDGFEPSTFDYFTKWMFRILDIYLLFGLVGILSIIFSKKNQRLGEMAAGIATISLRSDFNIQQTILTDLDENYQPKFAQVVLLTDNDLRIIKENYTIAKKNKNVTTLSNLTQKIEEVLKIKNPYNNDEDFITTIIKDYNFYTQYN